MHQRLLNMPAHPISNVSSPTVVDPGDVQRHVDGIGRNDQSVPSERTGRSADTDVRGVDEMHRAGPTDVAGQPIHASHAVVGRHDDELVGVSPTCSLMSLRSSTGLQERQIC
jgi:hypothetical protein